MNEKNTLQILDCSLRDGGYYTNWDFKRSLVEKYFEGVNDLPIDFVEIGYRSKERPGYFGAYFYCPENVLLHAKKHCNKKLAIIINEKEIKPEEIEELLQPCIGVITMIRMAVAPDRIHSGIQLSERIKKLGFLVSLNVMYFSTWAKEPNFLLTLKNIDFIDFIYFVDSYGGAYPSELRQVFKATDSTSEKRFGFHAHNNLELAHINTLTAIEYGASIVDATITGIGRGAGNLKTELLLTSLHAQGVLEVNFETLSNTVEAFSELKDQHKWDTNLAYMVSGANSLPQKEVMAQIKKRYYSLESIVRGIDNRSKGIADNLNLQFFSPRRTYKNVVIIGGGESGTSHSFAILDFLKKYPNSTIIHASSKNARAYKEFPEPQYHCLIGNEGRRLLNIFNNMKGTNKIGVLPPYPRSMGTFIPDSIKENAYQIKNFSRIKIHLDSVTALAVETALLLNAKNIFFVGYDGYQIKVEASEMELFRENDEIFEHLTQLGINFCFLTPTLYTRIPQKSIFSKI